MNLFAVFHGEYEDRDLYGVFTSLGKATAFLVNLNGRVMQGACRGGRGLCGPMDRLERLVLWMPEVW